MTLVVLGGSNRGLVVRLPNGGTKLSWVSGFVVCTEMLLSATDWPLERSTFEAFSAVVLKSSFLGEVELRKVETSSGSWVGGR